MDGCGLLVNSDQVLAGEPGCRIDSAVCRVFWGSFGARGGRKVPEFRGFVPSHVRGYPPANFALRFKAVRIPPEHCGPSIEERIVFMVDEMLCGAEAVPAERESIELHRKFG